MIFDDFRRFLKNKKQSMNTILDDQGARKPRRELARKRVPSLPDNFGLQWLPMAEGGAKNLPRHVRANYNWRVLRFTIYQGSEQRVQE